MLNLEIKAVIPSIEKAKLVCESIGASFVWEKNQKDIYFSSPTDNRLKIRIEDEVDPYLVVYNRPNEGGARECEYSLHKFSPNSCTLIRSIFSNEGKAHKNTMFVLPCSTFCQSCCSQISLNRLELAVDKETPNHAPVFGVINIGMRTSVVVKKTRMLFMWENVRVHLDNVEGLGNFLEFEHPVQEHTIEQVKERLDFLSGKFGIFAGDSIEFSYSDLLISAR